MVRFFNVDELLHQRADLYGDHPAILAAGRAPLTYAALCDHVQLSIQRLRSLGVSRHTRVAVVLPEGSELATLFLTLASCAVCVPVNPAYSQDEMVAYIQRLHINAVIVADDEVSKTAQQVAELCELPVITLTPEPTAGTFRLDGELSPASPELPSPDDLALLLSTSGTTYQPKIVPLTRRLLCLRAASRIDHYGLTEQDRLLSVMPMFHSASLTALLMVLVSGGSVICPAGFHARDFLNYVAEYAPTWCTAPATIYEAVLDVLKTEAMPQHAFRFLRAGSMALPAETYQALERTFKVPIIQGYSSSETGAVSANPLTAPRAGSVGVSMGLDIRIVDSSGQPVTATVGGEIEVRGAPIIAGYLDDPKATADAFRDGWFRTGDYGYIDADGYLFLVGRVKEAINRGGEKIFPIEVEDVLRKHNAVMDVAVFGVPHRQLGEVVGAAVVVDPTGEPPTEKELRRHAAEQLAYFKVPAQIVFCDALPRTANGKLQRNKLAAQLNLTAQDIQPDNAVGYVAPRTDTERALVKLWSGVLNKPEAQIGIFDRFASLGGDSLGAATLVSRIRHQLHIPITMVDLLDTPVISDQARVVEALRIGRSTPVTTLIPLRTTGNPPALFCIHALKGAVYIYRPLAEMLPSDIPVYGLQAVGIEGEQAPLESVDEIADHHLATIRAKQAQGPYFLCGYSFGGRVCLEIARRLRTRYGEQAHVLMIDDHVHKNADFVPDQQRTPLQIANTVVQSLSILPEGYRTRYLREKIDMMRKLVTSKQPATGKPERDELPPEIALVRAASFRAARRWKPEPYDGDVMYLRASGIGIDLRLFATLKQLVRGKLTIADIPGRHSNIMTTHLPAVAEQVQRWLSRIQEETTT